jgi:uncharacterized protein (TIGR02996 family)
MIDDTEAALLAAIRAAPDDDAPRLVYADWLTERGDPRGELITLQCRAEEDPQIAERVKALLDEHGAAWKSVLPAPLRNASFRRGFLARIYLDEVAHFALVARALAAFVPVPEDIILPGQAHGAIAPDGRHWAIAESTHDEPVNYVVNGIWRIAVYDLDGKLVGAAERQWSAGEWIGASGFVTGIRFSRDSRKLLIDGDHYAQGEIVLP